MNHFFQDIKETRINLSSLIGIRSIVSPQDGDRGCIQLIFPAIMLKLEYTCAKKHSQDLLGLIPTESEGK